MALLNVGFLMMDRSGRVWSGHNAELRHWFIPVLQDVRLIVDVEQKIVWQPSARDQLVLYFWRSSIQELKIQNVPIAQRRLTIIYTRRMVLISEPCQRRMIP
jgi:hypothetical protein